TTYAGSCRAGFSSGEVSDPFAQEGLYGVVNRQLWIVFGVGILQHVQRLAPGNITVDRGEITQLISLQDLCDADISSFRRQSIGDQLFQVHQRADIGVVEQELKISVFQQVDVEVHPLCVVTGKMACKDPQEAISIAKPVGHKATLVVHDPTVFGGGE